MNDNAMILAGCFAWFVGYVSNIVMPVLPGMAAISVPNWLIPLLGKPKVKPGSSWAIFPFNLRYQLMGLFAVLWGIGIHIFMLDPALFNIIGLFSSIALGYLATKWLYKKNVTAQAYSA